MYQKKRRKNDVLKPATSAQTSAILVPNAHAQGVVDGVFLRPENHPTSKKTYKTCRISSFLEKLKKT